MSSALWLSPVTDVVVEFQNLKPGLEIVSSLGEVLEIILVDAERFGIAIGRVTLHERGERFNFPGLTRTLGVGSNPLQDLPVALAGSQFLQQCFGIKFEKTDKVSSMEVRYS